MNTAMALAAADSVGGPWGAGFGFLFLLIPLFWLGIFAIVFALAGRRWRRSGWYGPGGHGAPWANAARGAESTLAERFAQGDIDEKEYRARLEVLKANNSHEPPAK